MFTRTKLLLICSISVSFSLVSACATAPPADTIVEKVTPADVLSADTPQQVTNLTLECMKYSGMDAQMEGVRPVVDVTNIATGAQAGAGLLGLNAGKLNPLIQTASAVGYRMLERNANKNITGGIRSGNRACLSAQAQRLAELDQ